MADDLKFLEPGVNTFVSCNFATHFLQITRHVTIIFKESIRRYLFVFFQLLYVDVFTDITDSCVMKKARSMNHFFHSSAISVCVQLFRERLSVKVYATIPKGIVGGFEGTFLQRNLKEWYGRPRTYVCEY